MRAEELVLTEQLVLPNLLVERARDPSQGDGTFLQAPDGREATFAEVDHAVQRWMAALAEAGVVAGDTVLVMLPNCFESVYVWLAAARLGAVEVPINVAYRGAILRHVATNAGAAVAVVAADLVERLEDVGHGGPLRTVISLGAAAPPIAGVRVVDAGAALAAAGEAPEGVRPQRWDISCIMYTSGTTGPSKGVMVPWGQVHATALGCVPIDDLGPDDAWYSPFPLFHMSGKLALCSAALLGSRLVVRPGFSTSEFWPEIRRFRCTTSLMIGTTPAFLASRPARADDADSPLRNVLMAPVGDDPEGFMARFGVRISTVFNMTEISAPIMSGWTLGPRGTCGRLRDGYDVRIVDEHDEEVPTGDVGEIIVRPEHPWLLMAGYWQMPEETIKAWRNHWFHTGDAGRVDAEGNFTFVDRQKDAIRHRGENVSSMELEAEVAAHPAIAECAVIGMPSEWGEEDILVVVVETEPGALDPASLIEFLGRRVPKFMVPRYVSTIDALPKTPTEKVRKVELRAKVDRLPRWDREAALG